MVFAATVLMYQCFSSSFTAKLCSLYTYLLSKRAPTLEMVKRKYEITPII